MRRLIIPTGPALQYTAEKTADPIRLYVYTGQDGTFTLYEDEDINYNYEKNQFSTILFHYSEKEQTLTIGDRQGEFDGMLKNRTFEIVWVTKDNPNIMDFETGPDATVEYTGQQITVGRSG